MGGQQQAELPFDVRQPWERRVRESTKAFAAFAAYRDLGPNRTIRRAAAAIFAKSEGEAVVPGAWLRWIRRWEWYERVAAFDRWNDDVLRNDLERIRRARLEKLIEIDEREHLPRLIALGQKIDDLIVSGLGKITQTQTTQTPQTQMQGQSQTVSTQSLDRARQFELYKELYIEMLDAYFGPCRSLLDAPARSGGSDGESAAPIAIGRFEWVPDPDVPEPPAPPPVAVATKGRESLED